MVGTWTEFKYGIDLRTWMDKISNVVLTLNGETEKYHNKTPNA